MRRARELSAIDVRRLTKPGRHAVGGVPGLLLEVRAGGARSWVLRTLVRGKRAEFGLGPYPAVSLADARRQAGELWQRARAGEDILAERYALRQQRQAAARGEAPPGSFEAVAEQWLAEVHASRVTAGHVALTRERLRKFVYPVFGACPIGDIEPPDVLAMLRRITARGTLETARRVKFACGQVFRYGVALGLCKRDPTADLRGALPVPATRHHAAITEPGEFAELLRAIDAYRGHPLTQAALKLSALLFLRPGELRRLRWEWVDLDRAQICIPSDAMKRPKADKLTGRPHVVPLARQALAILREVRALSGDSAFVFPAAHTSLRPMSENTVLFALRRLGYSGEEMTAHGFRAAARTLAVERIGVAPEVVEAQLAHAVPDALGRAYNRTQYLEQRRELMQRWADYLDRLREGAQADADAVEVAA